MIDKSDPDASTVQEAVNLAKDETLGGMSDDGEDALGHTREVDSTIAQEL